jgi:hypothetical protein
MRGAGLRALVLSGLVLAGIYIAAQRHGLRPARADRRRRATERWEDEGGALRRPADRRGWI